VVNHNSQLWNQRLSRIAVKVHGKNVVPDAKELKFNLYQHGRVTRVGYFVDSAATQTKELTDINLTLYQNEPPKRSPVAQWDGRFFGLVTAATGAQTITIGNIGTASSGLPGEGVDVEWPLFCEKFYLIAEKSGGTQANTIQVQNIDDIELRLIWSFGHPPAFSWNGVQ
jgi:hypothetical protein